MTRELGPLPETTLAQVRNDSLNQTRFSDTGVAYWGSNWREVRKLYTADDMRAYALAEVQRAVAEWEKLRDPLHLHVNLLHGIPARLSREAFLHLAGIEPPKD